jgi:hypothetical protein
MILARFPGSARVSRVGFGVPPKQSFREICPGKKFAIARTRSPTREVRAGLALRALPRTRGSTMAIVLIENSEHNSIAQVRLEY